MESGSFISLILIFALNLLFFFSGTVLNSLVILSFWKSTQLRKKLCYFMIMVLSCCDLLAVSTNNPTLAFIAMLWFTGKRDVNARWIIILTKVTSVSQCLSLIALFVMEFDRYLAISYPIFHKTSVTKGRLLILFVALVVTQATLEWMSLDDVVLPHQVAVLIFMILVVPAMLFINYKLFTIARRTRKNKKASSGNLNSTRTFSLKDISSCLLASACLVVLSIPVLVYIAVGTASKGRSFDEDIAGMWAKTLASTNSTFNCLIFYWKNKILRTVGRRVIKSMKIRQQSLARSDLMTQREATARTQSSMA